MLKKSNANRLKKAWPFALLCLAASLVWLLPDRYPQISFTLLSGAMACAAAAVISLILVRRTQRLINGSILEASIGGALVLIGPAIGIFLNASNLSAGGLTIALALTPVVIAVATPALTEKEFYAGNLWPGILASAALLLAIPAPSITDWRSDTAMLLSPILTGIGCILFKRSAIPTAWKATTSFSLALVIFAAGALVQILTQHISPSISFSAAGIDTLLFLLTLLALSRLSSMQYTVRYTLVPLILLTEGPILVSRALINLRSIICAALLLIATISLLRSRAEENVPQEALDSGWLQR